MSVFCAIDYETCGPERYAACSIGLVRIENGRLGKSFVHLIRPPSRRVLFTDVHGLTWRDLCNQPTYPELWPAIADFVQGCDGFVAHNASFDRSVWRSCCETFGLPDPNLPFYCTLKGSRAALNLTSYRLNIVCSSLGIPLNHHEALSDALGCAAIFLELERRGLDVDKMRLNPPARKKCRCS